MVPLHECLPKSLSDVVALCPRHCAESVVRKSRTGYLCHENHEHVASDNSIFVHARRDLGLR
jgi:hypothetical protein